MTAIDIVIILLLVMFGVVGLKQGIIKEAVQLVGMIIILVIAFLFKSELGNIFCKWLPFFNFNGSPIEGMTALNILLYQVLGFVLIFTVLYESLIEAIYLNEKISNDFVNFVMGGKYNYVIITSSEWMKIKDEYIKNIKNGIKYEVKDIEIEEKNEENKQKEATIVDRLFDIVGEENIEFK